MKGYAPIVRPWLKAGLEVLLVENEARVLELRAVPEASSTEAVPQKVSEPSRARTEAPPARREMRQPVASQPARPASLQSGGVRAPAAQPAPASSRPSSARPSSPLETPGALPVERWPASWLALKDRRPLPQRPLVLWSYAGLGEDLSGAPDEARKRVIVRMLTELKHPVGTHVFWPFELTGDEPPSGASLFWSGVKLLNPRVVLLFGSDTRDALAMPKTLLPFCQERVHGRLIIQLPRPQALVDESAFRRAQAFLSRILRFCANR